MWERHIGLPINIESPPSSQRGRGASQGAVNTHWLSPFENSHRLLLSPRGGQSEECSSQCTYTLPLHPGHTRDCNKIYTACLYNTDHSRADSCSEQQTHRSSDCHVALLFFFWSQRSAAEWHGGLKMWTEPPEGGRGSGTGRANSDTQRIVRDCWQFLESFNAT